MVVANVADGVDSRRLGNVYLESVPRSSPGQNATFHRFRGRSWLPKNLPFTSGNRTWVVSYWTGHQKGNVAVRPGRDAGILELTPASGQVRLCVGITRTGYGDL